jgi:uncharacterized iron-regulated protein
LQLKGKVSTIESNDAVTSHGEKTMALKYNCERCVTTRTRILFLIAAILFSTVAAGESFTYNRVLRLSDRQVITFGEMIREIQAADIVLVGEVHDDEKNHRAELDVIRALHEKRIPLAIGLEMFRAEDQDVLRRWVEGRMDTGLFIKKYYENWDLPWSLYSRIFVYSRDKRIPMIGLNVPERVSKKVSSEGFDSLSPHELKDLPPGISCDIDEKYMEFVRRAYEGHDGSQGSFLNFCEAQMVWDKAMAWHLVEYKKKNPSKTVVVLAGAGHSWKHGIPAQLKGGSKFRTAVILPGIAGSVGRKRVGIDDADYVLVD